MSNNPDTIDPITGRDLSVGFRRDFDILTDKELGVTLGVTVETLADWRSEKKGPTPTKLGGGVFYRRQDIVEWIDASVVPRFKAA